MYAVGFASDYSEFLGMNVWGLFLLNPFLTRGRNRFWISSVVLLVLDTMECMLTTMLDLWWGAGTMNTPLGFVCYQALFLAIALAAIALLRKSHVEFNAPDLERRVLVIWTVGGLTWSAFFAFFHVTAASKMEKTVLLLIIGLLTFVFFGMCCFMLSLSFSKQQYQELNALNELNVNMLIEQFETAKERDTKLRAFRHDVANDLNSLHVLLETQRYADCMQYLERMDGAYRSGVPRYHTGNLLLDGILQYLDEKFASAKVDVRVSGCLPAELTLDNRDLSVIFSNLIQNAYEAAAQTEARFLTMKLGQANGNLVFTLQNSCPGNVNAQGAVLQTGKSDRINHGIGTRNVRRCVERYHGAISYECKDNVFTTNLLLSGVLPKQP